MSYAPSAGSQAANLTPWEWSTLSLSGLNTIVADRAPVLALGGPSGFRFVHYRPAVNVATLTLHCQDGSAALAFTDLGTEIISRRCGLRTVHASAASGNSSRNLVASIVPFLGLITG